MKISTSTIVGLSIIFLVAGILNTRYHEKRQKDCNAPIRIVQDYLLNGGDAIKTTEDLSKSKKPILWIHVPYEYNSRNWGNFGSRSSYDLNQPYLYLTVRSIINHCSNSFTICIIDDKSFGPLLPEWNIDMKYIASPMTDSIRLMGLLKLIYVYGGLICPISFLCMKPLIDMYETGTRSGQMFVCETINKNVSASECTFSPSLIMFGAEKGTASVGELCNVIQHTVSQDFTADVKFLGIYESWCKTQIKSGRIRVVDGQMIGAKDSIGQPVRIDRLMANRPITFYSDAYGILIPSFDILNRRSYEWFARCSQEQAINADIVVGHYLALSVYGKNGKLIEIDPYINKYMEDMFVGFWDTPLYRGVYGLKPNFLGNNVRKLEYPAN